MTRPADEPLDQLVIQLAVEDVIALSDDEVEQDQPSKVDQETEADEDSEGFDYGDEDEFDYVYDDMVDSPPPAAAEEPSTEVEVDSLAAFRHSWQAEVEIAHQPPLAPPSLLKVFESPSLLRWILSNPLLGHSDLRSAALVTSAFLTPARALLFHRIDLDTPLRALRLLEVLEMSPHLAQHVDNLSISLGDLDAVLGEVPFVRARMKAARQEQDGQPNEWFWEGGGEVERHSGGREGKQVWEENLRLKLGKWATTEEMEQGRKKGLFEQATQAGTLSEQEEDELRTHLQRTFSSWPFDGAVDPLRQDGAAPSTESVAEPLTHPVPIPTLSPTFARNLLGLLSTVPNLIFASPAMYSASSALLPGLHHTSNTRSLIINPLQGDNSVARRLGVALDCLMRACRLSLRPDGLGLAGAPTSIEHLDIRHCTLVNDAVDGDNGLLEEGQSWSLQELELEQVGVEQEGEVEPTLPLQNRQDASFPATDLLRFIGASTNTLACLSLNQVDGFSWASINATILAHSSTLATLKLNSVNVGSTYTPSLAAHEAGAEDDEIEDVDLVEEREEEEAIFTQEQTRDFSPFAFYYRADHYILSKEEIARRTATPAGLRAYERDEEIRLLSFKLWERWIGPAAIPLAQVRKEQQQRTLAFHHSLASIGVLGSSPSSTFDPSSFDRPHDPSLLYALSRCSSLRRLQLTSQNEPGIFEPVLVEALLHARPPLEELEWSVKMEHRSRRNWVEWEDKVREVMQLGSLGASGNVRVSVSVSVQREGLEPQPRQGMKSVQATRVL